MAGLGALLTLPAAVPEGGGIPALACLVGGGLSLLAAIGLTKPPARQYFAAPSREVTQANPTSRADHGTEFSVPRSGGWLPRVARPRSG